MMLMQLARKGSIPNATYTISVIDHSQIKGLAALAQEEKEEGEKERNRMGRKINK